MAALHNTIPKINKPHLPPAVSNTTSSPKAPSAESNPINITGKIAGNDILLVSQKAQRNNTLSF